MKIHSRAILTALCAGLLLLFTACVQTVPKSPSGRSGQAAEIGGQAVGSSIFTDGQFRFWPHRGNSMTYPEETMEAYRSSVAAGASLIDCDVQSLSDGGLALNHDYTVTRLTTSSGYVRQYNMAAWETLTLDASKWLGGGWANTHPMSFDELLRAFGNRVPINVEAKDVVAGERVVKLLRLYGIKRNMVIVSGFSDVEIRPAYNAGYITGLNIGTYKGHPRPWELRLSGYKWIMVGRFTSTEQMDALRRAGLKVAVFNWGKPFWDRYCTIEPFRAHCDAIFSDDALYLSGKLRRTTDPFHLQTWYPGIQADNEYGRGSFFPPDAWGYGGAPTEHWRGALQGWANPMGGVNTVQAGLRLSKVTIAWTVRFGHALQQDRFAWVAVMTTDKPIVRDLPAGGTKGCHGYYAVCRKNGQISLYRTAGDGITPPKLIGPVIQTPGISEDGTASYMLSFKPDSVTLERTDVPGSLTVDDATTRGAFLSAGVKGCAASFSRFTITTP